MGGKVKDKLFERTWKWGGNLSEWKVWGLHIIVSGLANGGSRPKDRTDSERQALREDGKWESSFQKWHKIKKKMSFGFKHDLFSFALMILFAFHAKNTSFCTPPRFPRFLKWCICPFTPSPYAMEKVLTFIYINSIKNKKKYNFNYYYMLTFLIYSLYRVCNMCCVELFRTTSVDSINKEQ